MKVVPSDKEKPLRSPIVEGIRTLVFTALLLLTGFQLVKALVTGTTIFPARWNNIYVSLTDDPLWFVTSAVAWLLMVGLFGSISLRCWRRLFRAL